jgi:hypothetical protein
MATEYLIHDNGGRPFRVSVVDENHVRVDKIDTDQQILEFQGLAGIFIGASPKNPMTEFSGGFGDKFLGNSILLHVAGLTYVFLGHEIYQFDALAPIKTFVSPVGNNDVPYPFAFDTLGNGYLMLEKVCLASIPEAARDDPYDWYYETCEQMEERYGKLIIGDSEYNYKFSYRTDWTKEYDRLSRLEKDEGDVIYLASGANAADKHVLTLAEFVAQKETFQKDVLQATGLQNYQLLQKRW